jgi:hypothetical protein
MIGLISTCPSSTNHPARMLLTSSVAANARISRTSPDPRLMRSIPSRTSSATNRGVATIRPPLIAGPVRIFDFSVAERLGAIYMRIHRLELRRRYAARSRQRDTEEGKETRGQGDKMRIAKTLLVSPSPCPLVSLSLCLCASVAKCSVSQHVIIHSRARLKLDLILRPLGLAPQLREFGRIPGCRAILEIGGFILCHRLRKHQVLARRQVFKLE